MAMQERLGQKKALLDQYSRRMASVDSGDLVKSLTINSTKSSAIAPLTSSPQLICQSNTDNQ